MSYAETFFTDLNFQSDKSARILAKFILKEFSPKTLIDFGCGNGELCFELQQKLGRDNVTGIDTQNALDFGKNNKDINFIAFDLTSKFEIQEKLDIAVCLEVAEHLDSKYAKMMIGNLVNASNLVIFSAAIPGQGGHQHLNEQEPMYWAKLFWENGFVLKQDPRRKLRKKFRLAPWYKQNILIFGKAEDGEEFVKPRTIYHPLIFASKRNQLQRVYCALYELIQKIEYKVKNVKKL